MKNHSKFLGGGHCFVNIPWGRGDFKKSINNAGIDLGY